MNAAYLSPVGYISTLLNALAWPGTVAVYSAAPTHSFDDSGVEIMLIVSVIGEDRPESLSNQHRAIAKTIKIRMLVGDQALGDNAWDNVLLPALEMARRRHSGIDYDEWERDTEENALALDITVGITT